jgi:hypothetical protein
MKVENRRAPASGGHDIHRRDEQEDVSSLFTRTFEGLSNYGFCTEKGAV